MNYSKFGQHPLSYEVRIQYGRESRLPCLSGVDNSAPFDGDPLARLEAIIRAGKTPLPSVPQKKLTPDAIIESVLGMPSEDHEEMVMKGKASRELYRD